MTLHLAPNVPWVPIGLAILLVAGLAAWAYRFAIPPVPNLTRRLMTVLRAVALGLLLLLLAQPVVERASAGQSRVVVLLDHSRSMELPVSTRGEPRAAVAARAVHDLARRFGGRARIVVMPFAERLGIDSTQIGSPAITGIGDALQSLGSSPEMESATGVVIVSDGANNVGADPVEAARHLGVPVHTLRVGRADVADRSVFDIEAPNAAQAGRTVPVRVHVVTSEPRGTPLPVSLAEDGRELAHATIVSAGPGAESVAELHGTPLHPGLAVWTARVDSAAAELTTRNDARQVAFPVSPGRLGVLIVTSGLNWDVTFLRRALTADSSLEVSSWAREKSGWRPLEIGARHVGNGPDLHGKAVLVIDGLAPSELGPAFDAEVGRFMDNGGGVLALGGAPPGLVRLRGGRIGRELGIDAAPGGITRTAAPAPDPAARDLLAWDDDPARGERAWTEAAPLSDVVPIAAGAGDRVLVRSAGSGPPLLFARRAGRGQALLVNGTGFWRWSLSGHDELTAERGRRLWRGLVHWLAEPPQAEPLRVRPERWLTASGEPVRLIATLQDETFRPVSGAVVEGEISGGRLSRHVRFEAGAAGSYTAALDDLPPGRYRVSATAQHGPRTAGRAEAEFAVDRWSLEESRALPDSAELAAIAEASGGRAGAAADLGSWARLATSRVLRGRTTSMRLWESPGVFAVIVCALAVEWAWRRRRGLP